MNKILFLVICTILSSPSWGTEQIDDILSVGGKRYKIDELPLNQLYTHNDLSNILQQEMCSASWRGYQANWLLKDNRLWLQFIRKNPCSDNYEYIDANVLFKNQEYPIEAKWFSGSISLPVGEISYKYGSSEDELLGYDLDVFVFNFKNGELISKGVEVLRRRYENP